MSLEPAQDKKIVEASLRIPFATSAEAEIAYKVLRVDNEPRRNFVEKNLTLDCEHLLVHFKADQIRYENLRHRMPEHTPAPTPHRAIYGFSFYLLFLTLSIVYMLWALLPIEQVSGYLQLNYLPDKYFALCLPMLAMCGLFFFIFLIYPAISLSMTPNVDELASVVDIKLALRDKATNKSPSCMWEQLRPCTDQIFERTQGDEHLNGQECEMCHELHKRSKVSPIATLRFMDLSEMNNNFFS